MTAEEFVADRIRQLVAEAPPLTPEAVEVVRRVLRPATGDLDLAADPAA